MSKTVLVLGGYGGAGEKICRLLLKETEVDVVVAGRRAAKAEALSEILGIEYPGRSSSSYADASKAESLDAAFKEIDMVIAASTTPDHARTVASAALRAGIDYIDIHYPRGAALALRPLGEEIASAGLCFVTQAGFFPGLPSALVRLASAGIEGCRRADVGMAMNTVFEKSGALYEFLDSMADYSPEVYRKGRWRFAPWGHRRFDFGGGLGEKACYPAMLEEMRGLPEALGLDEAGVYTAGLNPVVDYVVVPIAYVLGRIRRGLLLEALATMTIWSQKRFSTLREEVALVLEAEGAGGSRIRALLDHEDPYYLAATSVVSCARRMIEGGSRPGLWMMGQFIDPEILMSDLKQMGILVETWVLLPRASVKKD